MPDHFYVYPAYLDRALSRSEGRRVPQSDGVPDVTAEEIVQAAKHLGFRADLENEKQYPRREFTFAGRVKVQKRSGTPKERFLRQLVAEIRRARGPGGKR
jgi:signal recognition particle subunit SRP19